MKLELSKEWYEENLKDDGLEAAACNPAHFAEMMSENRPAASTANGAHEAKQPEADKQTQKS